MNSPGRALPSRQVLVVVRIRGRAERRQPLSQRRRPLSDERSSGTGRFTEQEPPQSAAAIQRQVARDHGEKPPSYSLVYAVVRKIDPSLVTLAHEGEAC